MVTKSQQSIEIKNLNHNELEKRNKTTLNNITILAKKINSFDPTNVNDLFQNPTGQKRNLSLKMDDK